MRLIQSSKAFAIIVLCLACVASAAPVQSPAEGFVVFLGDYGNFDEREEHVYGYQLQLWRDADSLVGLWSRAEGQNADFPRVMLTDVRLDSATGAFRFTASWCGWVVELFEGVLTEREISGMLTAKSVAAGEIKARPITLKRYGDTRSPRRKSEWDPLIEKILGAFSPKC